MKEGQEVSSIAGYVVVAVILLLAVGFVFFFYHGISTAYIRHITTADEKLNQIRYETTSGELYRVVIFPDGITCYTTANERATSCIKN